MRSNPSYSKQELQEQISDSNSELMMSLAEQYSDQSIVSSKISRIKEMLSCSELAASTETHIARCPGRISLSKHADYINNDLLYLLDDRDIFVTAQKNDKNKLVLVNLKAEFENIELDLDAEADPSKWYFYPAKLYQALAQDSQGLTLVYSSDLPEAAGLSSSHALMLSTYIAIDTSLRGAKATWQSSPETRIQNKAKLTEIIELLQSIEHARGFKSGLGDQSAQLFGRKDQFCFIKLKPELQVEYQPIPDDFALITATSPERADKNMPEFAAANENIKAYKSINNIAKEYGCDYLGDLIYNFSDKEIFDILNNISDSKLRGLTLYGLGEAARVKNLKSNLSTGAIGTHLNLSQQAEQNFTRDGDQWRSLTDLESSSYELNPSKPLAEHSGIYRASTLINDQLQTFATSLKGVCGSSISGAGLGGSNNIICRKPLAESLKSSLSKDFHLDQKVEIHQSNSSNAAYVII
ncbi:MAG: hypothetical protein OXU45_09345 [Candidatus Melainabacteria bacterium]|nr:hypothetical protein [Candidatus Melainabacteria bacterium]